MEMDREMDPQGERPDQRPDQRGHPAPLTPSAPGALTDAQVIERLTLCRSVLVNVYASGKGIFYNPSQQEVTVLHGFMEVGHAQREEGRGPLWFEEVCQRAGLSTRDCEVLDGTLRTFMIKNLPPQDIERLIDTAKKD